MTPKCCHTNHKVFKLLVSFTKVQVKSQTFTFSCHITAHHDIVASRRDVVHRQRDVVHRYRRSFESRSLLMNNYGIGFGRLKFIAFIYRYLQKLSNHWGWSWSETAFEFLICLQSFWNHFLKKCSYWNSRSKTTLTLLTNSTPCPYYRIIRPRSFLLIKKMENQRGL